MRYFLLFIYAIIVLSCTNSDRIITLKVEDGTGLNEETNVIFKGQKVGKINSIKIVNNNIIAEISVTKELKLYETTKFYVSSIDVLGTRAIEIESSDSRNEYISSKNDTVFCEIKPSSGEKMIKEFQNLSKDLIDTLTNKLEQERLNIKQ